MAKINITAVALSAIIAFYLGTTAIHIPYLQLSPQINLVDLANVLLVLVLAVIIPTSLTRKIDDHRCEKNLIISEIDIFCSAVNEIDELIKSLINKSNSPENFTNVNSRFKSCRQHFSTIQEQVDPRFGVAASKQLDRLSLEIQECWEFITGDSGLKPNRSKITAPFFWRSHSKIQSTLRESRKLKFLINSH